MPVQDVSYMGLLTIGDLLRNTGGRSDNGTQKGQAPLCRNPVCILTLRYLNIR